MNQHASSSKHLPVLKPAALMVAAALALAAAPMQAYAAEAPAAAASAAKSYSIPAGPLSPALSQFAGQSGITLSSDATLTEGLSTKGLQGSFNIADGFARLLQGSGLEVAQRSAGVYVLRKLPGADKNSSVMPQITVTGQGLGANTENSGSYTGGSMKTATRMDMSIRDTPQSVSVITRERLNDLGVTRLDQALAQTTGIMIGQQDSERTRYYSRGFGINNVQVDGLPQGVNSPLTDTVLYDRIEVVRGATGLMGGTGDPSATVNMVRKRPTRDLQASTSLQYGRWNNRRAEADISTPLSASGKVRGRVALAWQDRDSYMDRYGERKTIGMAIVEADITPDTLLTVGADFQHNKPRGSTWGAIPYWNKDGSLANLPRNFSLSAKWNSWANEQETYFTTVDHNFGSGWKLHAGYARTNSRNNTSLAYGGAGYPDPATGKGMTLWTGVWGEGYATNQNYEAYLTGPFQLFGRRHTVIAGFNGGNQNSRSQGGDAPRQYPDEIPDYRNWTGDLPRPIFQPDGTHTEELTRLSGAYLAGRFSLADPLTVIVGARISNYSTETRAFDSKNKYSGTSGFAETKDEVTPYVGLVYDLNEQISTYASYTTLFNPQTNRDKFNNFLSPETGTNMEAGVKGEFFSGKLNASAAVFQTRKKNLAELDTSVPQGFKLPQGDDAYVANGDGIKARGVEFDVSGQISQAWNVSGGYTLLKAEEKDGRRAVPNQPRHLLRFGTAYSFGGQLQGLKLGMNVTAQSGIYGETWYGRPTYPRSQKERLVQGSYALVGAMASYQIDKHMSAQLNISNLLDKKYYRNVGFYDSVFWGEPRNVTATLTYKF
ncbi:TonB-dependent receptor [Massilia sp. BJB1822]|uniref:TonB-dependent siderophore receptor n=1 Tax=Massilia sp. BJB1822 TaxID=2744470 RepID=UPI0015948EA7|nr:TonB-dependent receptor [Massilia sp. BJB1822]NVD96712.1 TonB-dependent siderophore receptor [Massilia sp. BJB1822]